MKGIIFYLLIIITLISCGEYKPTYRLSREAVIAKTMKEYENKEPTYRLAFSSGYDRLVRFGHYSKLNVGDSVTIQYGDNWVSLILE